MVGGVERVYELGRVYRNEGIDARHNPEFTMLELYQAYGDYRAMMDLTEKLIVEAIGATGQPLKLPWGDKQIDFTPPFARKTYDELFREHTGVAGDDAEGIAALARQIGFETANRHPDVIKSEVFEAKVEDALTGPIFVIDYPASICPLTKRKAVEPGDRRAVRALRPRHGVGQRLYRVERPGLAGAAFQPAACRDAGRRVDGQHGPRLHPRHAARHAARGRAGHRHRPAGDAVDQHADHSRRDPVPVAETGSGVNDESMKSDLRCLRS